MTRRVLVTGARSAAALDIARDFARIGYAVHMADCAEARIARWSRAVSKVHHYPSPRRSPAAFRAGVLKLVGELDPVLVIPSCEEAFHLAALPIGARLFQPAPAMLARLHDKGAFVELCLSAALPAPETHAIDRAEDLEPFRGQSQEWVFKPRFGRFGEKTLVAPSEQSLSRIAFSADARWIAQRRIVGREVSFYAVAREGRVVAFSAYDSAWRLGGACLTFEPLETPLASAVLDLAARLAAASGLTGQFACDLIVDHDNRPWLIECNPRATSGVHLLAGDGRLAAAMLAAPAETVLAGDGLRHLLPAFATYGLKLALQTGRLPEWGRQLRRGRDVAGLPGDRWPALGAVADGLGFMLSGVRRGVSTVSATTIDIEWNGEDLR